MIATDRLCLYTKDISNQATMATADFAVQPASFGSFDEWGCDWATDINHAYRLAATYGEDAVIWRCPHQGEPMPWVRVTPDEVAAAV